MATDNQLKLVSICMPAYNAEKYIRETINCLLGQTYKNIELIIVDDGSTDNTLKIINSIVDSRIKVLSNPKKNAASARNFAYLNSEGDYIVFFDADDLVDHDFIEKQVNKLQEDENAIVLSNWGRFYNNDIRTYQEEFFIVKKDLTYKEWILAYWLEVKHTTPPGRAIISRKLIEKTPLWDETLTLNDDFQFFNELFFHCSNIKYNNTNFYYRSGINGLSSKKSTNHYISSLSSIKRGIYLAQLKYPSKIELKVCYANLLQNLKYEVYPNTEIIPLIDVELKKHPKSNFKFPAGGYTKLAVNLVGWKLTKHLKNMLNK